MQILTKRREFIVTYLEKFYSEIFGDVVKGEKEEDLDIIDKVHRLDEEDARNPFVDFKMQGEVQSYDLL